MQHTIYSNFYSITDLHPNWATSDSYVPNPYTFVGLTCPLNSRLKGFEKRNLINAGNPKLSFCTICSSVEAEFSICAPEDNAEISQNINFNALVVPNSTCFIDSSQNDSTERKCNLPASNTPYCGIKLNNQNKADRKELFQIIDTNQLIPCNKAEDSSPIGSLGISLGICLAIIVALLIAIYILASQNKKLKKKAKNHEQQVNSILKPFTFTS